MNRTIPERQQVMAPDQWALLPRKHRKSIRNAIDSPHLSLLDATIHATEWLRFGR